MIQVFLIILIILLFFGVGGSLYGGYGGYYLPGGLGLLALIVITLLLASLLS